MADFSIYSTTPGSAVADTLQQILARRKEEERQMLLDKMAQEEHQSTLAARTEQQRLAKDQEARQKAASEAQIAASNEDIFQSKIKGVRRGVTPDQISDEPLRQEIEKRGGFESIPVFDSMPEVGQEGLPTARMQQSYAGTTDEQNKANLETQFDELIMGTDDEQTRQALGVMRAGGPAISSMLPGRKAPVTVVQPGRAPKTYPDTLVPESQSVVEHGYPPAGPAALSNPANHRITYKDGRPPEDKLMFPGDAVKLQNTDPTVKSVLQLTDTSSAPRPNTIPQGVINRAQQALTILSAQEQTYQSSGIFDWTRNVKPELISARDGAEQAMAPIMANAPSDLVGLAQTILNDPEEKDKTVAQIISEGNLAVKDAAGNPTMSEEEIQILHMLVTYLRTYSRIRNIQ